MAQSNRISLQKVGYFNDGIFKVGKQTSKIDELKIFYNGLDDLVKMDYIIHKHIFKPKC